jgi:hypothetical protein
MFQLAFTVETIKAAFRATGVFPFDRTVITLTQMKPSEPTSIKGSFPLPQPSPVRAIMSAYWRQPPTAFDIDPNTDQPAVAESWTPATLPRQIETISIDPTLENDDSPSKRVRLMMAGLASTSSGSFLVSKSPITSQHSIPAPVLEDPPTVPMLTWSLLDRMAAPLAYQTRDELVLRIHNLTSNLDCARQQVQAQERIIEATHAQMVLQNIFVEKQSQVLNAKETRKENDRTKLFPDGKGRWLTDKRFIEELERDAARRQQKKTAKEDRTAARARKRAEKEAIAKEWKAALSTHAKTIEEWELECMRLRQEGVAKKILPKKPQRPKKRKPAAIVEDVDESCSDTSASDD